MDYPIFTEKCFALQNFVVWCPSEELFNDLLLELESSGVTWPNGKSVKGYSHIWDRYREESCVCVKSSKNFGWDSKTYFEEEQECYGPIYEYIGSAPEQHVDVEDLL